MSWKEYLLDPRVQYARRLARTSSGVLEDLWHAKDGSWLTMGLAGVSVASRFLDDFATRNVENILSAQGFKAQRNAQDGLVLSLLRYGGGPGELLYSDKDDWKLLSWPEADTVVNSYSGPEGEQVQGVFVRDRDKLKAFIQKTAWVESPHLMLTAQRSRRSFVALSLTSLHVPETPYVGTPDVAFYVDRLKRGEATKPDATRSVILVGPSGVGKGVLAFAIAQGIAPEKGRVLKIAGSILHELELSSVLLAAELLGPDILLLDDLELDFDGGRASEEILALFEGLRGLCKAVISTVMTDAGQSIDTFRCSGIRPGRVDDIYFLTLPTPKNRREMLLREYGAPIPEGILDDIVAVTEGMTGAYVVETAIRLKTFGLKDWGHEAEAVWRMCDAPRPKQEEQEEDEDE